MAAFMPKLSMATNVPLPDCLHRSTVRLRPSRTPSPSTSAAVRLTRHSRTSRARRVSASKLGLPFAVSDAPVASSWVLPWPTSPQSGPPQRWRRRTCPNIGCHVPRRAGMASYDCAAAHIPRKVERPAAFTRRRFARQIEWRPEFGDARLLSRCIRSVLTVDTASAGEVLRFR